QRSSCVVDVASQVALDDLAEARSDLLHLCDYLADGGVACQWARGKAAVLREDIDRTGVARVDICFGYRREIDRWLIHVRGECTRELRAGKQREERADTLDVGGSARQPELP